MSDLSGVPERPRPAAPQPLDAQSGSVGGASTGQPAFDPLRLCIYTTIALITWAFGPIAVLAFAILGLAGYWRAHQAGLTRTKCYLRDVRLVLVYLGLAAIGALATIGIRLWGWLN